MTSFTIFMWNSIKISSGTLELASSFSSPFLQPTEAEAKRRFSLLSKPFSISIGTVDEQNSASQRERVSSLLKAGAGGGAGVEGIILE
jgi:hypothetical protein